jgi:hypothetical protein
MGALSIAFDSVDRKRPIAYQGPLRFASRNVKPPAAPSDDLHAFATSADALEVL